MIRALVNRRLVLLLPLLALAGCAPTGGSGVDTGRFQGDAKNVARALSDLTDAARRKDGQRACAELLSRRIVDALGQAGGCQKAMDEQFKDADAFTLDVKAIQVDGDRATARVSSDFNGDKRVTTIPLVRESRSWRIDQSG
jgi:hypothetical protein